jgi:Flp pilus assembly protein TadG
MIGKIRNWLFNERGVSEAVMAIIILPIITSMLFVLVEAGFNMRSRAVMDSVVQDVVRGISLDGGVNNPRTNTLGHDWQTEGLNRLKAACTTGSIRCKTVPTIVCSPTVAANVGDAVTCSAQVTYKVISPLSVNPLFSLGFQGVFTSPLKVTITSVAATGSNG